MTAYFGQSSKTDLAAGCRVRIEYEHSGKVGLGSNLSRRYFRSLSNLLGLYFLLGQAKCSPKQRFYPPFQCPQLVVAKQTSADARLSLVMTHRIRALYYDSSEYDVKSSHKSIIAKESILT